MLPMICSYAAYGHSCVAKKRSRLLRVVPAAIVGLGRALGSGCRPIRRVSGELSVGRATELHARARRAQHDDKASGGSPNGSFFRPIPGPARGAIPPCVPGSSQSRQRRGGARARGAAPPCAPGSSENRQRREVGSRFLRLLVDPDVGLPDRGDRLDQSGDEGQVQGGVARTSIKIFPNGSRFAVEPGGTTQVESYSSMMQGPALDSRRSERFMIAVSHQPWAGPK